jgi:phosphoserine phosphatase
MRVFDFDKTLTYIDTLSGFYKEVALFGSGNKLLYQIKKLILIGFALIYKTNLISNAQLKKVGVWLFLKGCSKEEIQLHAKSYAKKIKLNDVYDTVYQTSNSNDRLILTASFVDYVQPIFPEDRVYGSELEFHENRVKGLYRNMYHQEKVQQLKQMGIQRIERVYTDSFSDKPLMNIADNCFLVKGNHIEKIK